MYKRNYHPLVILLYTSGMLDVQQIHQVPKTTRYNWNKFKHQNYDEYQWAESYINQFDDIKDVFKSKFTARAIKTILKARRGYYNMLGELAFHKNLLKLHADSIISSIEDMSNFVGVSVQKACKFYGISKDWYYREKAKIVCNINPFQKCYRQHPNQLTVSEITVIENLVTDPVNFGKTKITLYYYAIRNDLLFCGISTFNKYASALGYVKPKRFKFPSKKGFRASRVFEWLHVDITNVNTLEDGIQKVAFVKDNFSKSILHYSSTNGKARSEFIKNLFTETFDKFGLYNAIKPINILSDGGSENKGQLLSWIDGILAPPVVTKITAQTKDFPFSNSMSESTHSIYKTEFLNGKYSLNKKTHLKDLARFVNYYNNHRFPTELYGLTPFEVVKGKIPDKNHFKEKIQKAKKDRTRINQQFNDCKITLVCNS